MVFEGAVLPSILHDARFDAILVGCGYEQRGRAVAELVSAHPVALKMAWRFPGQHVHSFAKNEGVLRALGYDFLDCGEQDIVTELGERVRHLPIPSEELRLLIDVSSLSRSRIAALIEALELIGRQRKLEVVFAYSMADYKPVRALEVPNVEIGPVSARFAGWTADPERPVALIIGLGYEEERAMGACEELEPSEVWALEPQSSIAAYGPAIKRANRLLLSSIRPANAISYSVEDANSTFVLLSSLVRHASRRGRIVIVPGGPKLLALLAIILALEIPDVGVWRVSAGAQGRAVNRVATGRFVCLRCRFADELPMSEPLEGVG